MTSTPRFTSSTFLRRALLADALASGATAALGLVAAGPLSTRTGLPPELLRWAGLSLFPFVALLVWLATRERIGRGLVLAVVALNVLWVIDSVLLVTIGWVQPTAFGYIFTIAQAMAVAVFAELEYIGLRRSMPARA